MIRTIVWKDWKLLWPMVALVAAIQAGLEWASYYSQTPGTGALFRPLGLAWHVGIAALAVAVVQQDALPGAEQDWLIRPLKRTDLLLAKLAFMLIMVSLPMFVLNLAEALLAGFPFVRSLETVLYKEFYVYVCLIVPIMALATTTRNMTEFIVLGAVLVVVFTMSLIASTFWSGGDWCPTCDTGTAWLQHVLQHIGVLVGAGAIFALQYYRRRTDISRAIALCGAAALVFMQLSWNTAFSIQRWLSGSSGASSAVALEFGRDAPLSGAVTAEGRVKGSGVKETTNLLMQGRVDQAAESLHRRVRTAGGSVAIDLPVRATGISSDELLLVDRLEVQLFSSDGRLLYRKANADVPPGSLSAGSGDAAQLSGFTDQTVEIPGDAYKKSAIAARRLRMDYSLTLMKVQASHQMAAMDGSFRGSDVGLCSSQLDQDVLVVRCQTLGLAPFCIGATLYGPDGSHNPEVLKCNPDYRFYLPAPLNVLTFFGVDVPVRDRFGLAHYAVAMSELPSSHVLLQVYRVSDHFKRTLLESPFQLGNL